MKIKFWADVHVEHSWRSLAKKGKEASLIVLQQLISQLENEMPDYLIILGDFFDKHGVLEGELGVVVKRLMVKIAKELNIKIIFVVGNHEYRETKEVHFGKSVISALFSELEHINIFVIDETCQVISLDDRYSFIGLPYRETEEQFKKSCWEPLLRQLPEHEGKEFILGWHVGIPFGEDTDGKRYEIYAGDEASNSWIKADHPYIKKLIELSCDKTIYCGHYHGPSKHIPCGDGFFLYISSPASRTRAESGQIKRTITWHDKDLLYYPTNLLLDQVVYSIPEALEHQRNMINLFGEEILFISKIYVVLPPAATKNDYNIAVAQASGSQNISVDPITEKIKSKVSDIFQKTKDDVTYSTVDAQIDIAKRALFLHYFGNEPVDFDELILWSLNEVPLDLVLEGQKNELLYSKNPWEPLKPWMNEQKEINPELYNNLVMLFKKFNFKILPIKQLIITVQDFEKIIMAST